MYVLITANRNYSSWSLRPWMLMQGLGIAFDDRIEPFAQPVNYDAFRSFSPTGQVPALLHEGRTIYDSLGIALYLADRHDDVWPADADARAWAQCATAEMHSGFSALRNDCTMNVGVRVARKDDSASLKRDLSRIAEILEEGLSRFGGPYLAGADFTVADAFFAPVVFRIRSYDLPIGPLGRGWVERMLELPAMREWEEEALAEPYREEGHEEDLAATGSITADYRVPAQ